MQYSGLTLGEIADAIEKLGGERGVRRFLSGELELKKAKCKFDVWKTIKLGIGLKTAEDFRRALRDGGFEIGNWALDVFKNPIFKVASEETEIDLVKVTLAELGLGSKKGAHYSQINERAQELNLHSCPIEVGPQLRLSYSDQPEYERLVVATEPFDFYYSGAPNFFCIGRDDSTPWIGGISCSMLSEGLWCYLTPWVFCRRRSLSPLDFETS